MKISNKGKKQRTTISKWSAEKRKTISQILNKWVMARVATWKQIKARCDLLSLCIRDRITTQDIATASHEIIQCDPCLGFYNRLNREPLVPVCHGISNAIQKDNAAIVRNEIITWRRRCRCNLKEILNFKNVKYARLLYWSSKYTILINHKLQPPNKSS